jgi:exosortase/archaeosortase family protein
MKSLGAYFDFRYFIKFILIFGGLYALNIFWVGITTPGGIYSAFIANNLNYPVWLRNLVIAGSRGIVWLFGFSTEISSTTDSGDSIVLLTGQKVIIGWVCYGLQIMSFWFAFCISHLGKTNRKSTLIWTFSGLLIIWMINCLRISMLLLSLAKGWHLNNHIDNHDVFTYSAYVAILVMIVLYYKRQSYSSKNKKPASIYSVI